MKNNKMRVHFMGIGGSALSGVALMAFKDGHVVSGCDVEISTAYIDEVRKAGIKVYKGHSKSHLKEADLLAVSPAILYLNEKHPEIIYGKRMNIYMTWDEFVGKYLLENKEVICVTGTHGKSSTTSMAALLFEKAGFDPSALVGATVKKWNRNYRVGNSNIFIIEADDFFEKFLNYQPSTIILNNIEYDHPDFFSSEEDMINSYYKFIKLLKNSSNLIINQDSEGNKKLFSKLDNNLFNKINIYGYTISGREKFEVKNSLICKIIKKSRNETVIRVVNNKMDLDKIFHIGIPGEHNVSNSLGIIILGRIYSININTIGRCLKDFKGAVRRLEMIGNKHGVKIYDDYAHHPTAIKETLKALRQKYPLSRIWVIIEPHSYSRTKALLKDYKGVFEEAYEVIVGPIYKARDKADFGISGQSIIDVCGHKNSFYIKDIKEIIKFIKGKINKRDVIIVMGAGYSYKWAREIYSSLD